jgi:hypothetical protein
MSRSLDLTLLDLFSLGLTKKKSNLQNQSIVKNEILMLNYEHCCLHTKIHRYDAIGIELRKNEGRLCIDKTIMDILNN